MPREWQLGGWREDPDVHVPVAIRRQHEHGLREVHLARDVLHPVLGDLARVREHGELVAGERGASEDVGDDVSEAGHGPGI